MQTKRYNVTKAGRKYQDNQGNEKTVWNNIGTLTEFYKSDGSVSRLLEIPAIGLEANVFLIEPKQQATKNTMDMYENKNEVQYPEDTEISIPF